MWCRFWAPLVSIDFRHFLCIPAGGDRGSWDESFICSREEGGSRSHPAARVSPSDPPSISSLRGHKSQPLCSSDGVEGSVTACTWAGKLWGRRASACVTIFTAEVVARLRKRSAQVQRIVLEQSQEAEFCEETSSFCGKTRRLNKVGAGRKSCRTAGGSVKVTASAGRVRTQQRSAFSLHRFKEQFRKKEKTMQI